MPAVEKITIAGFKSIAQAEVELRPVNVLIGANGSGKSNFMEAFALLHAIGAGQLPDYVARAGGANRLLHYGAKVTDTLKIRIRFEHDANEYGISLKPTADDRLYQPAEYGLEKEIPETHLKNHLSHWRIYHFHDTGPHSPLKKTADLHDNRYLRENGANLPAFLHYLRENHPFEYKMIRSTTQRIAPFFDDFHLEPMALNQNKIRLEWRHKGIDASLDVSALSDGTLRFIALATLFLQPKPLRSSVILLDEPELGLNPAPLALLEAMAASASVYAQVIMATQSPYLLDHFIPDEVLVADRVKGGATEFTRLDPERLEWWLKQDSLGGLWSVNHFGGKPAGSYHERRSDD